MENTMFPHINKETNRLNEEFARLDRNSKIWLGITAGSAVAMIASVVWLRHDAKKFVN